MNKNNTKTDISDDVIKNLIDELGGWDGSNDNSTKNPIILNELVKIINCIFNDDDEEKISYLQKFIAEVHPRLYLVVAHKFISFHIFKQHICHDSEKDNFETLHAYFLSEIRRVIQYSVENPTEKGSSILEEQKRYLLMIIDTLLHQYNSKKIGKKKNWPLVLVKNIILEVAKTDIEADFIFDLEDRLNSVRFGKKRQSVFSSDMDKNEFQSVLEIHGVLNKNDSIKKKICELNTENDEAILTNVKNLFCDAQNQISINWLPFAEQTPFSVFFSLLCCYLKLPQESIRFKKIDWKDVPEYFKANNLTVAVHNQILARDLAGHDVKLNNSALSNVGNYRHTRTLLTFKGYNALVKMKTLINLHSNKKPCLTENCVICILMLNKAEEHTIDIDDLINKIRQATNIKFYHYDADEFKEAAKELDNREEPDISVANIKDFLKKENQDACYFTGAIQARYISNLFPSHIAFIPNMVKNGTSKARMFFKAPDIYNAPEDNQRISRTIDDLWKMTDLIVQQLCNFEDNDKELLSAHEVKKIRNALTHDFNLYSHDFIASDFKPIAQSLKSHSTINHLPQLE